MYIAHYSVDTWKKTVRSQCFLRTKDSQVFFFFANVPIKFKHSTMQPLKTLNRLNLPDLSGNRLSGNFKPFELTRPLRKQTSKLWPLLFCLQKNLRNFCFQKMLCSKYFSLSVCNKLNQQLVLLVLYISLINLHEGNKALSVWFSHGL